MSDNPRGKFHKLMMEIIFSRISIDLVGPITCKALSKASVKVKMWLLPVVCRNTVVSNFAITEDFLTSSY